MDISVIFFIQIIVTILFSFLAAILDLKNGIIPLKLNYSLLFFGLASNLILSLITGNIKYILASFISMIITNCVVYMLWQLEMWGGGDVRLFTAIASVIPIGVNIDFLNVFPEVSFYPFAFTVIINSILVSFPFLLFFFINLLVKNKMFKNNIDFIFNMINITSLKLMIDSTLNERVYIKDLKEGNIVNNYYFNNEYIIELIDETDGNLKVYENNEDDEYKYYFKSLSAGGITKKDMYLLKIMNAQKIISDEISIKISFPFAPSILFGLIIAVFYGDIMLLFTKNLILVI